MRLSFADGLFWSSVACCALAQFFILRSVREGGRRHAPQPAGPSVPQPRGTLEMLWAVVPAVALAVLLMATWREMHEARPTPSAPVTEAVR
jgi:heme/copper-type cytochrome/quinol oxidase subunit 2